MKYDPNYSSAGPFTVIKWNRRLYIQSEGVLVYSPPNFVRVVSRDRLKLLAEQATVEQGLHIHLIAAFERNSSVTKRTKT